MLGLSFQGIHAINLGDSGFMVIRDGCTIFRSPVQQHDFNFTYQLESGINGDLPSSGQVCASHFFTFCKFLLWWDLINFWNWTYYTVYYLGMDVLHIYFLGGLNLFLEDFFHYYLSDAILLGNHITYVIIS